METRIFLRAFSACSAFNIIAIILILLFLTPSAFAASSTATNQNSPSPSAFWQATDGHANKADAARDQAIYDFTQIAFSNSLWLGNSGTPSATLLPFKSYLANAGKKPAEGKSWLPDSTYRANGIPPHDRVVKWTTPVSVGIGWPQYGYSAGTPTSPELVLLAAESVKDAIAEIKSSVSQPIAFMSPDDPTEKTIGFAKIRIVFLPETGLRNHFKFLNFKTGMTTEDWYMQLNQAYVGAIPFTPSSSSQVDGFLLPNADNSLGLAVCRLVSGLPHAVLKGLIKECLVRSMGLTETLPDRHDSVLSAWNSFYDKTEKTPVRDGEQAIWAIGPRTEKDAFYSQLPNANASDANKITEYDKAMLSLLYCPTIRPGMDKYEAIIELLKNTTCFKDANF